MPSLGADMEDGTLAEWTVVQGDTVNRGDVIAVIETQKGAIEIECFETGVVSKLMVEAGKTVPVGAPLAIISDPTSPEVPDPVPEELPVETPPDAPAPGPPEVPDAPPPEFPVPEPNEIPGPTPQEFSEPRSGNLKASPAARHRAHDLGIDLSGVHGTGPQGVIVLGDVEPAKSPPLSNMDDPKDTMRKAIAAAMTRSKQSIPHFYLSQTIDVQKALDHLVALNADHPPAERILLGALFVQATALAARDCPTMNGHYLDGTFQPSDQVNVGFAIALRGGGLVAPAIIDADKLSLEDTMSAMRDLVSRARTGRLRGTEMTAGTLTLSSLGESGAEAMAGVIFPPQVALVGVGAPQVRPWVINGTVEPRSVISLTISVDHRVNDGRWASKFIASFESHLNPSEGL